MPELDRKREDDDMAFPFNYKKPKRPVVITFHSLQQKLEEYDAAIEENFFKRFYKKLFGCPADITALRTFIAKQKQGASILDEKQVETLINLAAKSQTKPREGERRVFDAIETCLPETVVPIAFLTNLLARYDQQKGWLRKWWKGDQADILKLKEMVKGLKEPTNRNLTIQEQYQLYEIVSAEKTVPGHLSADIFEQIQYKLDKGTLLEALERLKNAKLNSPEHYEILHWAPPTQAIKVSDTIIFSANKQAIQFNSRTLTLEMKQAMAINGEHADKIKNVIQKVPILICDTHEEKYTEKEIFEKFKLLLCQQGQYADGLHQAIVQIRHVLKMDYIDKIACSPKDAIWIAKALIDTKTAMQTDLTKEQILALCQKDQAKYLVDFAKIKHAFDEAKLWDDDINQKLLDNADKISKLATAIHNYHPSYDDLPCVFTYIKSNFAKVLTIVEHADIMISALVHLNQHQLSDKYQPVLSDNPQYALAIAQGLTHLKDKDEDKDKKAVITAGQYAASLGDALGRASEIKGADKQLLRDHPQQSLEIVEIMGALDEMKKLDECNKAFLQKLVQENPEYLTAVGKCLRQLHQLYQLKETVSSEQLQNNIDQLFAQASQCEKISEFIGVYQWLEKYHNKENKNPLYTQKNIAAFLLIPAEEKERIIKILNFYYHTSPCNHFSGQDITATSTCRLHNVDQIHYDLICQNARHADRYISIFGSLREINYRLLDEPKNFIKILRLVDYYPAMEEFLQVLSAGQSSYIGKVGYWSLTKPIFDQDEFELFCANVAAPGFLQSLNNTNAEDVINKFNLVMTKARFNESQKITFFGIVTTTIKKGPDPTKGGMQKAFSDMKGVADKRPISNVLLDFIGESFDEKPKLPS